MSEIYEHDYAMERRLKDLDPELHRRFTDAVFAIQHVLSNYKLIFPEYTDHTELHSLSVIDFCNRLIGDQIEKVNADELYALLVSCYFHDTGMGVSEKDFVEFSAKINFGNYFDTHDPKDRAGTIRDYHNEFSGLFIQKYADLFELPSDTHLFAVMEIARGHRKTRLKDKQAYPISLKVPNGHTICTPYLAALIRLADEIDISVKRNPMLLYDTDNVTDPTQIFHRKMHEMVKDMIISFDHFTVVVKSGEPEVLKGLQGKLNKMQETLDDCREAVNGRTPFEITQKEVVVVAENAAAC